MKDIPDPRTQLDKFKDLARELECDEDEKAFEDKVKKVAKTPTRPADKKSPGG